MDSATNYAPIDLLDMLRRIGFSLVQSNSGVWYASKIIDNRLYGYFASNIDDLYHLCVDACYNGKVIYPKPTKL